MRFLNNLNTGLKITLLAIFLLLFVVGISIMGMTSSRTIKDELDKMYNENLMALSLTKEAKVQLVATSRSLLNMAVTKDLADREKFLDQYNDAINSTFSLVRAAKEKMASPESLRTADRVLSGLEEMRRKQQEALTILTSPDATLEEMSMAPALSKNSAIQTDQLMSRLSSLMETEAEKKIEYAQTHYDKLLFANYAFLAMAFFLGIGMSLVIVRAIAPPLREVTRKAKLVADGDLDQRFFLERQDEIGSLSESLNTMVETLRKRINEAEQKSEESARQSELAKASMAEARKAENKAEAGHQAILQAAVKVDEVVNRLFSETATLTGRVADASKIAGMQSDCVTTSATAMEEMNCSAIEVAKNAAIAAEESESSSSKAKAGEDIVNRSLEAITSVQKAAHKLKEQIEQLGGKAKSIGAVLTVINDIADQTNLLALNAAIEAARAGEAGRGFSVVADEVKKLAEKTMVATREVELAIRGIQDDTTSSIAAVENSVEQLDHSAELVSLSGESLTNIVAFSEKCADQVRSIAIAAGEQLKVSEEVASSLSNINRMAEETVHAMSLSTEAVDCMAAQASELQKLVADLRA